MLLPKLEDGNEDEEEDEGAAAEGAAAGALGAGRAICRRSPRVSK